MKKIIMILAIFVMALFIAGCAAQKSPDIVCNSPYIRHGAGCCMDKNTNSVCDSDEEEEPLFVEPDYAPSEDTGASAAAEDEPVYIPPSEDPEEVVVEEPAYHGAKDEVTKTSTAYTAPEATLAGWEAENEHMSIKVTKIVIDVVPVEPRDLRSPDKEAYLKEMYLTIKNKDYNYLNPEVYFRVGDSKDRIIIKETLLCDRSDDIVMEGCDNALPETETMNVRMQMDRRLPGLELEKTFRITLTNRRDTDEENVLVIEKTHDILDIFGVTYI